ncbi:diguanylate cyclase [Clostridium sp. JNZ X4-2]
MIQNILSMMNKNFVKVDMFSGVNSIQRHFYENNIKCFVVYEFNELVGVVTEKELITAHPNRIIADVMSDKYAYANENTYLWEVMDIFNLNKDLEVVLVKEKNIVVGFVTKTVLKIELGRHVDLLTGLYKNDYIFYNAYKFIKKGKQVSIIFIDLDNFGFINKKYGHVNGDKILKLVASILKENITSDDICLCRYAGDEFAILTSYCLNESEVFAKKLIKLIRKYNFPDEILVSVSIGMTEYKVDDFNDENDIFDSINKLVNNASLASTKAKSTSSHLFVADNKDKMKA